MTIRYVINNAPFFILTIIFIIFVVKLILHLQTERAFDPVRFFHYTKVDLRLSNSKRLRAMRKNQNTLTQFLLALLAVFLFFLFLNHF